MATVHFSRGLARYTGGVESLTVDARRVGDLVREVTRTYPGLSAPLEVMAVAVDGEVHPAPEYLELAPDADVHFIPQVAGG